MGDLHNDVFEVYDETGDNFTIVPNAIIDNGIDLKPIHLAVYLVFKRFAYYREIKPSRERISMMAGATKPTVDKAIKDLEELKLIRVERKKSLDEKGIKNEKNVYTILKIPTDFIANAKLCSMDKKYDLVMEMRKEKHTEEKERTISAKEWDTLKDMYVKTGQNFTDHDKEVWKKEFNTPLLDTNILTYLLEVFTKKRDINNNKKRLSLLKICLYYIKKERKTPTIEILEAFEEAMNTYEPKTINKAVLEANRKMIDIDSVKFLLLLEEAQEGTTQNKIFHATGGNSTGTSGKQLVSDYDDVLNDLDDLLD